MQLGARDHPNLVHQHNRDVPGVAMSTSLFRFVRSALPPPKDTPLGMEAVRPPSAAGMQQEPTCSYTSGNGSEQCCPNVATPHEMQGLVSGVVSRPRSGGIM